MTNKTKKIIIKIPATTANFGSGFDTFGAALDLRNTIEALIDPSELRLLRNPPPIVIEGEGKDDLPDDKSNLIWVSMSEIFRKLKLRRHPIKELKFINKIPLSSGLGSSAAAIAGGMILANEISPKKISRDQLINIAANMEGHPDNIVPAFVGGFCVCYDGEFYSSKKISYIKIPMPHGLKAVVSVPCGIRYSTAFARRILPEKIPVRDAVFNISRAALLAASLALKKFDCIAEAMNDRLHQPKRFAHISGARESFAKALSSGALGVALSGSGPSLLAITKARRASSVASALKSGFASRGINSRSFILDFAVKGAIVE